MVRLIHPTRLAVAALLSATLALGTAHYVTAQEASDAMSISSVQPELVYSGSPPTVLVASEADSAVDESSETAGRSVVNNPPQPGDAFPTDQWGSTD